MLEVRLDVCNPTVTIPECASVHNLHPLATCIQKKGNILY